SKVGCVGVGVGVWVGESFCPSIFEGNGRVSGSIGLEPLTGLKDLLGGGGRARVCWSVGVYCVSCAPLGCCCLVLSTPSRRRRSGSVRPNQPRLCPVILRIGCSGT
ncbi:hypothetical protein M406DRAFT_100586, partial [Cryphonectria parasitica EP155]